VNANRSAVSALALFFADPYSLDIAICNDFCTKFGFPIFQGTSYFFVTVFNLLAEKMFFVTGTTNHLGLPSYIKLYYRRLTVAHLDYLEAQLQSWRPSSVTTDEIRELTYDLTTG
jgi:hypothetical protein